MNYLTFPTPEAALAADARAFAFLKAEDGARGGSWSGVFTNGTLYGILRDPCIEGAFDVLPPIVTDNAEPAAWSRYTPKPVED
jgi:hypothetical protein